MKRKLKTYRIFKVDMDSIISHESREIKIKPVTLDANLATAQAEIINIQDNQLTNFLFTNFNENPQNKTYLIDKLINVTVPTDKVRTRQKEYITLAHNGFDATVIQENHSAGVQYHYVRLCSGSGQIRRNTITFIREDLYSLVVPALMCGLTFDDFGSEQNAAKFNAYFGLNISGCHLLTNDDGTENHVDYSPNVCIVDDYEAIIPETTVNWVTEEKNVQFITLPDGDYVLAENQKEFLIDGKYAVRKSDNERFKIHKGTKKQVTQIPYNKIPDVKPLNSFDGQGLMSPEWAEKVKTYLKLDFIPAAMIIRAPWIKGLLACVPFHEWFFTHGITEITDTFGKVHQVEDIDCLISRSQFKMAKAYERKYGVNAWECYTQEMKKNHLLWGVTRTNSIIDDDIKTFNYQYLQALQIKSKEDIQALTEPTKDYLRRLNSGDFQLIYETLCKKDKNYLTFSDENYINRLPDGEDEKKKLFQRIIEINHEFVKDAYVQSLILKECQKMLENAKIGKILIRGNYQFMLSDPIAQLEWIAFNHGGLDIEIKGVVPEGCIYSDFWLTANDRPEEIVLMRSPMIDRNEIAKRTLMQKREKYFKYLNSGIIYSIHDLTPLQQGGADFDGDIVFSTNNEIIRRSCYDFQSAKPLYYELPGNDENELVGIVSKGRMIKADANGLNSGVGKLSNKAGILYSMLEEYPEESAEYKQIYDGIIELGQVVGMEIDRIKTGIPYTEPLEWKVLFVGDRENISEAECKGIMRHKSLAPGLKKPYYFRYVYPEIDKKIRKFMKSFEWVSAKKYGCKVAELGDSEEEMRFRKRYKKNFPAIDTECITNIVCHDFEEFAKDLPVQVSKGENLLKRYTQERSFDQNKLNEISDVIKEYSRFSNFITKNSIIENRESYKKFKEDLHATQENLRRFYFRRAAEIINPNPRMTDFQAVFDYLMKATKDNEKIVFEILGKDIARIIEKAVR